MGAQARLTKEVISFVKGYIHMARYDVVSDDDSERRLFCGLTIPVGRWRWDQGYAESQDGVRYVLVHKGSKNSWPSECPECRKVLDRS